MNEDIHSISLLIVMVWPLLLAIPAVRSRLPWPGHLAIMPAAVRVILPGDSSFELSWLFFGTEFAIDGEVRWILAMTVAVWLLAATAAKSSKSDPTYDRTTTFFLLTLAGNVGVVLATDLVGFFSFSTLMGYSFYGLMIHGGNAEVQRAGRLYLIFLIVADLVLFEALLLAASTTEDLRYKVVRQAMVGTSSTQFYLWMALVGFVFKAGIWPAQLWLSSAFKSVPFSRALLLGGVPVSMGLLGMVRWLPFGEHAFYVFGMVIQMIGVASILYGALRFFTNATMKMLPAWSIITVTGFFMATLGTGLVYPALWSQYEYLTHPFIASLGIFLAALTFTIGRLQDTRPHPAFASRKVEDLSLWVGKWIGAIRRSSKDRLFGLQSLWRGSWLKVKEQPQRILDWGKPAVLVGGWSAAITMFVLLGLMLAWLAR